MQRARLGRVNVGAPLLADRRETTARAEHDQSSGCVGHRVGNSGRVSVKVVDGDRRPTACLLSVLDD
jgi:hypothetical protein